jgi:ribosomal protein L15
MYPQITQITQTRKPGSRGSKAGAGKPGSRSSKQEQATAGLESEQQQISQNI